MEEVKVITLPKFDPSCEAFLNLSESEYGLPDIVVTRLHHFVQSVATMYQENPFHNTVGHQQAEGLWGIWNLW